MKRTLTALGEYLIDFTPAGTSPVGMALYERNPGGAPANVAAGFVRLGGSAFFAGAVGDDPFGRYLKGYLEGCGVDCRHLVQKRKAGTTLAFVTLDERGDRSFAFYRDPGADTLLSAEDLKPELFPAGGMFHFGSLSLTAEPSRGATLEALKRARQSGMIVSYDPNWRPLLWQGEAEAKQQMLSVMESCHLLKVSGEELELLSGHGGDDATSLEKGSGILAARYGIPVILVTLGAAGCFFRTARGTGFVPTFTDVKTIDTTGAGDSFFSAFLYRFSLQPEPAEKLDPETLMPMLRFASASASLSTTRRGAIPSLPGLPEVESFLGENHD